MTRRLLALALAAALPLMNVQAADLHMHAGTGDATGAHRHGPALHHHDAVDHHASETTGVAAVDDDGTVIHVTLAAASAPSVKQCYADVDASRCDQAAPAIVEESRIVARAHGPPSVVQHSLRAPPLTLSL